MMKGPNKYNFKLKLKGHEFTQYDALGIIAGLFYNFTFVEMKGLNKTFRTKKKPQLFCRSANFAYPCQYNFLIEDPDLVIS